MPDCGSKALAYIFVQKLYCRLIFEGAYIREGSSWEGIRICRKLSL